MENRLLKKIVLTNDDGPYGSGLLKLADTLAKDMELIVVVPDSQRSATGKALTFNKPIRVYEHGKKNGYRLVTHDGTPADSVPLAQEFVKGIDMFVSGINSGANIGYQSMLTSGTVGAALEAAMQGYPALAASRVVNPQEWFNPRESGHEYARECEITCNIVKRVLKKGLPEGIDALNLNFPCEIDADTSIIYTKPTIVRMSNDVERRLDPNGSPYYWLRGVEKEAAEGTDAHEVITNGNISLSPIVIESARNEDVEKLRRFMTD